MRNAAGALSDALALAATPVLAGLAVLQSASGDPALCSAMTIVYVDPMTMMYAVMALFHAKPWLAKLARAS